MFIASVFLFAAGSTNVYDATIWVARVLTSLIKIIKTIRFKNRLLGKV